MDRFDRCAELSQNQAPLLRAHRANPRPIDPPSIHQRSTFVSAPLPRSTPTLAQLFREYFVIGATGFGGSMVWLRRTFVEKHGWLSADEFNEALSLCQFLPGPMVFNYIVIVARHFHGVVGMLVSSIAVMLMPFVFAVLVGSLYARYGDLPDVQGLLRGVGPVAAGLVLSLGAKTAAAPAMRNALAVFALVTFVAVAFFRVSLPMVFVTIVPLAILAAALRKPR